MSIREAKNNSPENNGYEEFLRGVELISLGLRGCSANLNRRGSFKLHSGDKRRTPIRTVKDNYTITILGEDFFEASGSLLVTLSVDAGSEPFLTVECDFEAHLHAPKPIPRRFVERFVESEFKLIILPYARQFVQSITTTMSIPPVVIPLSISAIEGQDKKAPKKRAKTRR